MIEGPNIYSFDSRVRYSEAGEDMFLTPGALIDYFQDCSTLHTQDCGVSMDYLKGLGFAWIMISWQIRISKMPKLGDSVRTKTWAVSFRSFFGDRQYTLEDPAGGEYARAFGIWVLMDMVKGKPVRVPDHMVRAYGIGPKLDMEQVSRKIRLPEEERHCEEPFRVGRVLLDSNHHVNNAQYISLAADYLPAGFPIHSIRAEYRKQAKLGDEIFPWTGPAEGGHGISLQDAGGDAYAVVLFQ